MRTPSRPILTALPLILPSTDRSPSGPMSRLPGSSKSGMISPSSSIGAGSGATRGAAPGIAPIIKSFHIRAGTPPPLARPRELLSSLPIQTPTTRSPAKPTNSASRLSWLVPVLPNAGIPSAAARPVPLVILAASRSRISSRVREPMSCLPSSSLSKNPFSLRGKACGSTGA